MLSSFMSNSTSLSEEASVSSVTRVQDFSSLNLMFSPIFPKQQQQLKVKKTRSTPGNPDPDAEVIALSPKSLMATNRFVCEICKKGFQRDQNLQLHRRGHNLPWKLRQRSTTEIRKRVYVCPEPTCVHNHPSRALGDLTGIKKHFSRKHGEKKWKCEKCSKKYAVQSDWKAHTKSCGTKEYRCDCGTLFSRKDSFITHRAFCDALAEETAKFSNNTSISPQKNPTEHQPLYFHPQQNQHTFPFLYPPTQIPISSWDPLQNQHDHITSNQIPVKPELHYQNSLLTSQLNSDLNFHHQPVSNMNSFLQEPPPPQKNFLTPTFFQQQHPHSSTSTTSNTHTHTVASNLSATALLQKAVNAGVAAMSSATQSQSVGHMTSAVTQSQLGGDKFGSVSHMGTRISPGCLSPNFSTWQKGDSLTRDFLGLTGDEECGNAARSVRNMFSFTSRAVDFPSYDPGRSLLKHPDFGFADDPASDTWG
ncbi:indeterminate-domain [Thalictrum thalictroides]|uniref:Indeterminate-domain n=1 Tax=Thalictrum thalictroides TaxID=46969 RepID=A0A7J6VPZ6_THATH|nr:indeterminate-domain [Thalictrum thalictroides]